MEDRYLRHGDRLLLKVDGKLGYVSANDRTVPQVRVEELAYDDYPPDLRSCVFEVTQRFQYNQKIGLVRELAAHQLSEDHVADKLANLKDSEGSGLEGDPVFGAPAAGQGGTGSNGKGGAAAGAMGDMAMALFSEIDDPKARYRLAQLHTAAGREARVNAEEFMQVIGEPVVYGQVVQLRHVATGRFLTIRRTAADVERGALKVVLEAGGSEGSWFQIFSGYRTKPEGARVLHGEVVALRSLLYGGSGLHLSSLAVEEPSMLPPDIHPGVIATWEVSSSPDVSTMRLVPFSRHPRLINESSDRLCGHTLVSIQDLVTNSAYMNVLGAEWEELIGAASSTSQAPSGVRGTERRISTKGGRQRMALDAGMRDQSSEEPPGTWSGSLWFESSLARSADGVGGIIGGSDVWRLEPIISASGKGGGGGGEAGGEVSAPEWSGQPLRHGTRVRLRHVMTGLYLSAHTAKVLSLAKAASKKGISLVQEVSTSGSGGGDRSLNKQMSANALAAAASAAAEELSYTGVAPGDSLGTIAEEDSGPSPLNAAPGGTGGGGGGPNSSSVPLITHPDLRISLSRDYAASACTWVLQLYGSDMDGMNEGGVASMSGRSLFAYLRHHETGFFLSGAGPAIGPNSDGSGGAGAAGSGSPGPPTLARLSSTGAAEVAAAMASPGPGAAPGQQAPGMEVYRHHAVLHPDRVEHNVMRLVAVPEALARKVEAVQRAVVLLRHFAAALEALGAKGLPGDEEMAKALASGSPSVARTVAKKFADVQLPELFLNRYPAVRIALRMLQQLLEKGDEQLTRLLDALESPDANDPTGSSGRGQDDKDQGGNGDGDGGGRKANNRKSHNSPAMYQALVRQTGLLSSVVRCLANCRVVALLQLRLLRHTPAGKAVVELAAHCHRLLQLSCRGCESNQGYVASAPGLRALVMSHLAARQLHAEDTLAALYEGNMAQMQTITRDVVSASVALIRTTGHTPRFMHFLAQICGRRDRPVPNNQNWLVAEILDSPGQDPREIFFPAGPGLGLDAQGHKVESWLVHACGFKRDPVTGAITTKRKDHVHETSDGATVDKPSSPAFFNEAQEEGVPPLKPELVGDALQGDTQGNWHAPSADADAHAEEEEEEDDSNTLVIDCAGFRAAPEDSTTEGIHQWEEGQPALQGKGEPGQLAHGGPTFGRPSNAAPLVHMHSGKAGTALSGLGAAGPGSSTERDLFMYYCYSLQLITALCEGRNALARARLLEASAKYGLGLEFDCLHAALVNPVLPYTLRSVVLLTINALYVDVDPYQPLKLPRLVRMLPQDGVNELDLLPSGPSTTGPSANFFSKGIGKGQDQDKFGALTQEQPTSLLMPQGFTPGQAIAEGVEGGGEDMMSSNASSRMSTPPGGGQQFPPVAPLAMDAEASIGSPPGSKLAVLTQPIPVPAPAPKPVTPGQIGQPPLIRAMSNRTSNVSRAQQGGADGKGPYKDGASGSGTVGPPPLAQRVGSSNGAAARTSASGSAQPASLPISEAPEVTAAPLAGAPPALLVPEVSQQPSDKATLPGQVNTPNSPPGPEVVDIEDVEAAAAAAAEAAAAIAAAGHAQPRIVLPPSEAGTRGGVKFGELPPAAKGPGSSRMRMGSAIGEARGAGAYQGDPRIRSLVDSLVSMLEEVLKESAALSEEVSEAVKAARARQARYFPAGLAAGAASAMAQPPPMSVDASGGSAGAKKLPALPSGKGGEGGGNAAGDAESEEMMQAMQESKRIAKKVASGIGRVAFAGRILGVLRGMLALGMLPPWELVTAAVQHLATRLLGTLDCMPMDDQRRFRRGPSTVAVIGAKAVALDVLELMLDIQAEDMCALAFESFVEWQHSPAKAELTAKRRRKLYLEQTQQEAVAPPGASGPSVISAGFNKFGAMLGLPMPPSTPSGGKPALMTSPSGRLQAPAGLTQSPSGRFMQASVPAGASSRQQPIAEAIEADPEAGQGPVSSVALSATANGPSSGAVPAVTDTAADSSNRGAKNTSPQKGRTSERGSSRLVAAGNATMLANAMERGRTQAGEPPRAGFNRVAPAPLAGAVDAVGGVFSGITAGVQGVATGMAGGLLQGIGALAKAVGDLVEGDSDDEGDGGLSDFVEATVSNLLAANNLQDESDNSIFSNVLNAAAPALSFTATKAAQTKALGATFHRISDNTGVLGPQPASPGAGAGPGAGNVYSNKVSSALFKLDPLGDAGDKFTNSELSAVGCVLDVARYDDPVVRARCFAMVERLLSKREKLVNALMRTFVAADPQLVSVSRWAAAQVEVALASYTHMASLDEGQRIKACDVAVSALKNLTRLLKPGKRQDIGMQGTGSITQQSTGGANADKPAPGTIEHMAYMAAMSASTGGNGQHSIYITKTLAANCQYLLHDLQAHDVALKFLKLPLPCLPRDAGKMAQAEDPHRLKVFAAALVFLRHFCVIGADDGAAANAALPNAVNQAALLRQLPLLSGYLDIGGLPVPDTIAGLFAHNRDLAIREGPSVISRLAKLVVQYGHKSYGRWLDVLRRLMVVDGTPIKRNQVMVMKLATQYDSQLLHLLPGPGGRSKISELMGTTQINPKQSVTSVTAMTSADGELVYHCACVKLLAECCVGGDTELIVRASGYVSLPHAMAVLMMRPPTGASPTTVRYVSRAYWALLHHTYFATDTEHTKGQVRSNPKLWPSPEASTQDARAALMAGAGSASTRYGMDTYGDNIMSRFLGSHASIGPNHALDLDAHAPSSLHQVVLAEIDEATQREPRTALSNPNSAAALLISSALPALTQYFEHHYSQHRTKLMRENKDHPKHLAQLQDGLNRLLRWVRSVGDTEAGAAIRDERKQALEVVRALQKAIEKRHGPGGAAAVAAAAAASTAAGGSQPGRPGSTAVGPARGTSQAGGPEGAPPSTRSKPGLTRGGPGGMSMKHSAGGHSAGGGPPSLISSNHKDEKAALGSALQQRTVTEDWQAYVSALAGAIHVRYDSSTHMAVEERPLSMLADMDLSLSLSLLPGLGSLLDGDDGGMRLINASLLRYARLLARPFNRSFPNTNPPLHYEDVLEMLCSLLSTSRPGTTGSVASGSGGSQGGSGSLMSMGSSDSSRSGSDGRTTADGGATSVLDLWSDELLVKMVRCVRAAFEIDDGHGSDEGWQRGWAALGWLLGPDGEALPLKREMVTELRLWRQAKFNAIGAVDAAVALIAHPRVEVQLEALSLLLALSQGGHQGVQDHLYELLSSGDEIANAVFANMQSAFEACTRYVNRRGWSGRSARNRKRKVNALDKVTDAAAKALFGGLGLATKGVLAVGTNAFKGLMEVKKGAEMGLELASKGAKEGMNLATKSAQSTIAGVKKGAEATAQFSKKAGEGIVQGANAMKSVTEKGVRSMTGSQASGTSRGGSGLGRSPLSLFFSRDKDTSKKGTGRRAQTEPGAVVHHDGHSDGGSLTTNSPGPSLTGAMPNTPAAGARSRLAAATFQADASSSRPVAEGWLGGEQGVSYASPGSRLRASPGLHHHHHHHDGDCCDHDHSPTHQHHHHHSSSLGRINTYSPTRSLLPRQLSGGLYAAGPSSPTHSQQYLQYPQQQQQQQYGYPYQASGSGRYGSPTHASSGYGYAFGPGPVAEAWPDQGVTSPDGTAHGADEYGMQEDDRASDGYQGTEAGDGGEGGDMAFEEEYDDEDMEDESTAWAVGRARLNEADNPFVFTMVLLKCLKEMLEGHHTALQMLLQSQPAAPGGGIDMVVAGVELLNVLQDNIQQALLAADHEVPSLMVALLTFLNELVQGPCYANQKSLSQTNFLVSCNRIFGYIEHAPPPLPGVAPERPPVRAHLIASIKTCLLGLLLSLLEGLPNSDIPNRCMDVLDFLAIDRQVMRLVSLLGLSSMHPEPVYDEPQDWEEAEDGNMEQGVGLALEQELLLFSAFVLKLNTCAPTKPPALPYLPHLFRGERKPEVFLGDELQGPEQRAAAERLQAFLHTKLGHVEVCWLGRTEPQFFLLTPDCQQLVDSAVWCETTLNQLSDSVSPDSRAFPAVKAAELVGVMQDIVDDIERDSALQQRGGRLRVLYIIVSYRVFLLQAAFYLAIAALTTHTLTGVRWTTSDRVDFFEQSHFDGWKAVLLSVIVILQLIGQGLVAINFAFTDLAKYIKAHPGAKGARSAMAGVPLLGGVLNLGLSQLEYVTALLDPELAAAMQGQKRWRGGRRGRGPHGIMPPPDLQQQGLLARIIGLVTHLLPVLFYWKFWYIAGLCVASAASFLFSPFFLVIHFSIYFLEFESGQVLAEAMMRSGVNILNTFVLAVLFIYVFAVITFLAFKDPLNEEEDGPPCVTFYQCMGSHMLAGIMGDIRDLFFKAEAGYDVFNVVPEKVNQNWVMQLRSLFVLVFFMLWQFVIVNIFIGLIASSFEAIRDDKKTIRTDSRSKCLVCSLDMYTFDEATPGGFGFHVAHEHSPLQYVFFLHHLRKCKIDEYNGVESMVATVLRDAVTTTEKGSWLPVSRALSLQHAKVQRSGGNRRLQLAGRDGDSGDEGEGRGGGGGGGGGGKSRMGKGVGGRTVKTRRAGRR